MSIFSKLFGTKDKKITTESYIEQILENVIREAINNNPLKGTEMEGISIMGTFGDSIQSLKKNLKENIINHHLSDNEIDELVDKIEKRTWNKYMSPKR